MNKDHLTLYWLIILSYLPTIPVCMRSCPHVAGDLWHCIYFYTFMPFVHTKPQFYVTKNKIFWKLWSKWRFWEPDFVVLCIVQYTEFLDLKKNVTACDKKKKHKKTLLTRYICNIMESINVAGMLVLTWLHTRLSCLFLEVHVITYVEKKASLSIQAKVPGAVFKPLAERTEWRGSILILIWKTWPLTGHPVDLLGYVWMIFFYVHDKVWTKAFLKMNEG